MNEKVYTAWFPQCCAPTLVTRDMADMHAFLAEHGKVVCKPLHGMGGRSIFVVEQGDKNANVILETLTEYGTRYAIVQRYLPEIAAGDTRVLLIDGEAFPHGLARIPKPGETRGNLAAGGRGEVRPLTPAQRHIAEQVGTYCRDNGLMLVGLDVIAGHMTEFNVTSPTCMVEILRDTGLDPAAHLVEAIDRRP